MTKKLFAVSLLCAALSLAGDDKIGSFTLSGTAACFNAGAKRKTAIQCSSDAYVTISFDGSSINMPSSTNGVFVAANKLYDAPTVASSPYVCAIQATAGGNCQVFVNRGPTE